MSANISSGSVTVPFTVEMLVELNLTVILGESPGAIGMELCYGPTLGHNKYGETIERI